MKLYKIFLVSLAMVFGFLPTLQPAYALAATTANTTEAYPVHISISTGKVDTNIIKVGLTKQGNLDVPPNFIQTGWYKYGPVPGQIGSAVIDGHVDNGGAVPGPFKNLDNVKVGDTINVTMSNGKTLAFGVTDLSVYPTKSFPSNIVFNQTGQAYLKLITCNGTFVPAAKTYDKRLVVTAVLLS